MLINKENFTTNTLYNKKATQNMRKTVFSYF